MIPGKVWTESLDMVTYEGNDVAKFRKIKIKQDWVAFMSQPYRVEVRLRLILRLRLI